MSTLNRRPPPTFQLELLETRTLLAGDAAIAATGDYITNYEDGFSGSELAIGTQQGGQLTIDATLLPDTITSLKISGFSSVTINGTETLRELNLSDIGSFAAAGTDVNGTVKIVNVGSLKLNSVAGIAYLSGNEMRLDVFDARSVTILSAVEKLTISTKNGISLMGRPEMGDQEVRLEFKLDNADILAIKNIIFPQDSEPGTPPPGENDHPGDQPPYVVIIIVSNTSSVAVNTWLAKLQDALRSGDAGSIKTAFEGYVQSIQTAGPAPRDLTMAVAPDNIAVSGTRDLPALSSPQRTPESQPDNVVTRITETPQSEWQPVGIPSALVTPDHLPPPVSSDTPDGLIAAPKSVESKATAEPTSDGSSATFSETSQRVVDAVRITLAGLVSGLAPEIQTVSAYILDRVGTDLEPGVLPGLLVDARAARAKRDAVDWFEV